MGKRTCDACGKKKELGEGKTCEKGYSICSSRKNLGMFSTRKQCPLCKKPLR